VRLIALAILIAACAGPRSPGDSEDLSSTTSSGGGDLASGLHSDLAHAGDLSQGDGSSTCTLGTPDHCGTCGTVCPPGMDSAGTQRTCSNMLCDFICKGEYYDVDGKTANGCEAQDLPLQDSSITAVNVNLPNAFNTDLGVTGNPANIVSQVYGDSRTHDAAPTSRLTGREDWYKLMVTGGGSGSNGVTACLGITNFPSDDIFEVCLSESGSATFTNTDCKQAMGMMPSVCVAKAMAADESGTYYARVRKISGTWTSNQYALFLEH
jgi:hypothetical protein